MALLELKVEVKDDGVEPASGGNQQAIRCHADPQAWRAQDPPPGEAHMRAVLQRVTSASVRVDGQAVSAIGRGLLVLVGVAQGDGEPEARWMAEKTANLRIFEDDGGKMNLSVLEAVGEVLAVSQFTLLADARKGRRPGFSQAAAPKAAEAIYLRFAELLGNRDAR